MVLFLGDINVVNVDVWVVGGKFCIWMFIGGVFWGGVLDMGEFIFWIIFWVFVLLVMGV